MSAIKLENKEDKFLISIDKGSIDEDVLTRIIDRIRLEQLAQEVGIEDDLEELGREIKAEWWQENKERLLNGL